MTKLGQFPFADSALTVHADPEPVRLGGSPSSSPLRAGHISKHQDMGDFSIQLSIFGFSASQRIPIGSGVVWRLGGRCFVMKASGLPLLATNFGLVWTSIETRASSGNLTA